MRATTANDDNVFDINNFLLHPATVFTHPRDIGADPVLSISGKRGILASWAFDVSARPHGRSLGRRRAIGPTLGIPIEPRAPASGYRSERKTDSCEAREA
jgi:hypothetical protein